MLNLYEITLIAVTSIDLDKTIKALMYSSKDINFFDIKLITHEKPVNLPNKIKYEYIDKISNINEWNYQIVYNLTDYIQTPFAILIHDDGFIVNPNSWRTDFLEYDYIGAKWGHQHLKDHQDKIIEVGNSVSLRSKKLLDIPKKFNMPWIAYDNNFNEDTQICVWNRNLFLKNNIKYAPVEIAKYFSHEEIFPEYKNIDPFCFHNFGGENIKYKEKIENFNY